MHEAETRPRSPGQKNPEQAYAIKRLAGASTVYHIPLSLKRRLKAQNVDWGECCVMIGQPYFIDQTWALEEAGKELRKDAENEMNSVSRA